MQLVHVYCNFAGSADEALKLYETVFGTRVSMRQTFGETTFIPNVPWGPYFGRCVDRFGGQ